jgi:hypothetical protein
MVVQGESAPMEFRKMLKSKYVMPPVQGRLRRAPGTTGRPGRNSRSSRIVQGFSPAVKGGPEGPHYFSDRYASRSALNEPSHSSLPTRIAIAVPVKAGVAGPRAISVTTIVFGSIVAAI